MQLPHRHTRRALLFFWIRGRQRRRRRAGRTRGPTWRRRRRWAACHLRRRRRRRRGGRGRGGGRADPAGAAAPRKPAAGGADPRGAGPRLRRVRACGACVWDMAEGVRAARSAARGCGAWIRRVVRRVVRRMAKRMAERVVRLIGVVRAEGGAVRGYRVNQLRRRRVGAVFARGVADEYRCARGTAWRRAVIGPARWADARRVRCAAGRHGSWCQSLRHGVSACRSSHRRCIWVGLRAKCSAGATGDRLSILLRVPLRDAGSAGARGPLERWRLVGWRGGRRQHTCSCVV
mmetsp:Transcript_28544/g.77270  ORF Transcript_28544/g.77270 Transcript_28544/m.77270 type:complete len:290 (-) Transcript_28544:25-894(-)